MSDGTAIEWCARPGTRPATWNPVVGCSYVHEGCRNCYAVAMSHRLEGMGQEKYVGLTVKNKNGFRHFNGVVREVPETLDIPRAWRLARTCFVNSMSDLFHPKVHQTFTQRVFAVMNECPRHTFIILTKRPRLAADLAHLFDWTPNIWLLASVSDQPTADEMIPQLLRCPAAVRGVSYEPALGPVDLSAAVKRLKGDPQPNWIIFGGESGKGARPCDLSWPRAALAQCRRAGAPFFLKQLGREPHGPVNETGRTDWGGPLVTGRLRLKDPKGGDMSEWPEDLRVREFPCTSPV